MNIACWFMFLISDLPEFSQCFTVLSSVFQMTNTGTPADPHSGLNIFKGLW